MYIPNLAFQQSGEGHLRFQGSEMHIPHHISESLETIFWVKILKFFDADPEYFDPGSGIRMEKFGSGINIPDPQHTGKKDFLTSHQRVLQREQTVHRLSGLAGTSYTVKPLFPMNDFKKPVLRIHDIFVWIRIGIRGSMPLTNGSGSGFGSWIRILLFSS